MYTVTCISLQLLQQVLEAEQRAANIQPTTEVGPSDPGMGQSPQVYDNHPIISLGQGLNGNIGTSMVLSTQEPQSTVLKQIPQSNDSQLPDHSSHNHHFLSSNIPMDNRIDRTSTYNVNNQHNPNMSGVKQEQSLTLPQLQQAHHQHQLWTANHMFLTPANYHGEVPRVPSPVNMTYLTPSRTGPVVVPFQTPPLMRNRPIKRRSPTSDGDTDKSCDEDEIDVVNESRSQTLDSGKDSDVSMLSVQSGKSSSPSGSSTKSSSPTGSAKSSSPTGSTKSCSPTGSGAEGSPSLMSPQNEPVRKKARTNYSPSQVQALERVFHENPYPDSEKMEALSLELDIPEGKIKVWFQNKRARWRRRAQDNSHMTPFYAHMSPMMSPMAPYGFMNGMLCASPSPAQVVPNTLMYPSTPTTASSTTNSTNSPQQSPTMTSPYQSRGHIPTPYFPVYPYGMFPPYYCS
ncbi:hypothetical protein FSP39_012848 [Pinctada imbricata]|uniref:Homeobox domain-containing protein n=1 Tax=Pinctada imbricata TaxID=66713 RepID=A0AA88YCR5_PINIB|nr:hypothetical protein FSP39_012848 [Pinctada imbricata]